MNTELAKRSHLEKAVSDHYSNSDLLAKIYQALPLLGLPQEGLTPSALSAVDEFHIGGSEATKRLAEKFRPLQKFLLFLSEFLSLAFLERTTNQAKTKFKG